MGREHAISLTCGGGKKAAVPRPKKKGDVSKKTEWNHHHHHLGSGSLAGGEGTGRPEEGRRKGKRAYVRV